MEEEKVSKVYFSLAKRIVDTVANGLEVSKQALLHVLKPLLEDNITPAKLRQY